jgi:MOSC domain-containing protein YiiM
MKVVSLRVGEPAEIPYRGGSVLSTIAARRETAERIELGFDGFTGDRVADPELHGGPDKAVCCFPTEHLARLAEWMHVDSLPEGAVGENLSLTGLLETDAHIGDVFRVGSATVQVSQPRGPCFKLAARWGVTNLPAKLSADCASGFYFRVIEPGAVAAGDALERVERGGATTVAEVMRVTYVDRRDLQAMVPVLQEPALAMQWKAALLQIAQRGLARAQAGG